MNSAIVPPNNYSLGTLLRGKVAAFQMWTADWHGLVGDIRADGKAILREPLVRLH